MVNSHLLCLLSYSPSDVKCLSLLLQADRALLAGKFWPVKDYRRLITEYRHQTRPPTTVIPKA